MSLSTYTGNQCSSYNGSVVAYIGNYNTSLSTYTGNECSSYNGTVVASFGNYIYWQLQHEFLVQNLFSEVCI